MGGVNYKLKYKHLMMSQRTTILNRVKLKGFWRAVFYNMKREMWPIVALKVR